MRFFLVLPLIAVLAGCGSSSSTSTSSSSANRSYHNAAYHFSFKYPAGWTPGKGKTISVQGVPTYELSINTPNNASGVRVLVDHQVIPFPAFQEGHVAPDPSGGPDIFHYHHTHVSGWPAMQIQRYNGSKVDGVFTIVNTQKLSFQFEIVTPTPPFSQRTLSGYDTMVRTAKLPFS